MFSLLLEYPPRELAQLYLSSVGLHRIGFEAYDLKVSAHIAEITSNPINARRVRREGTGTSTELGTEYRAMRRSDRLEISSTFAQRDEAELDEILFAAGSDTGRPSIPWITR